MQVAPIEFNMTRELTKDDLASLVLRDRNRTSDKAPQLKRIRERHHKLARLLAEGRKEEEVATMCNYSVMRIQQLMKDPSFSHLVKHYREMVNEEFIDFQSKLAEAGMDGLELILDRMEENPDDIEMRDLVKIVTMAADRTGHGPSQKSEVTISFGERLARAKERLRVHTGQVIEEAEVIND